MSSTDTRESEGQIRHLINDLADEGFMVFNDDDEEELVQRFSALLRSPAERGEGEELALAAIRAERDFIKRECWGLGSDRSGESRLCGEVGEYCQTCTDIRREIAKMKDRALTEGADR